MKETKTRSIIKTMSWRVVATLTTTVLVLIVTGNFTIAVGVGSLEVILKSLLYYLHERAWGAIKHGKHYA